MQICSHLSKFCKLHFLVEKSCFFMKKISGQCLNKKSDLSPVNSRKITVTPLNTALPSSTPDNLLSTQAFFDNKPKVGYKRTPAPLPSTQVPSTHAKGVIRPRKTRRE